jgi:hypothetical protein
MTIREIALKNRYQLWDRCISQDYCNDPNGYQENDVIQAAESFAKALENETADLANLDKSERNFIKKIFNL